MVITVTIEQSGFLVFLAKKPTRTEQNRFGPGCINKKYYFSVWLYFLVKTGPNWTVNTPTTDLLNYIFPN